MQQAVLVAGQAHFVEIEVENLGQLGKALDAGARRVLLGNINIAPL